MSDTYSAKSGSGYIDEQAISVARLLFASVYVSDNKINNRLIDKKRIRKPEFLILKWRKFLKNPNVGLSSRFFFYKKKKKKKKIFVFYHKKNKKLMRL